MTPGTNKEGLPYSLGFEQRLREARDKGNTLEAIKIKQEVQRVKLIKLKCFHILPHCL